MNSFEFSIDRELDFMIKYQLTADELFLIRMIFYAKEDHNEYISKFFTQCHLTKDLREVLIDLQNKSIINKSYIIPEKGEEFYPKDVDFNKHVIKAYFQHSEFLGMELFENYPASTVINGRIFSLRNITKLYKSLDEMCFAYGKEIKFDPEKHKEVLELLKWGKENNILHSGICDFISSRKWIDLQQLRDSGITIYDNTEIV